MASPTLTGHALIGVGRVAKGYTTFGPKRPLYATWGRCQCGDRYRSNEAPSKGGRRRVRAAHAVHVQALIDAGVT